uniref:Transport and Golgi organization protein 2 n=2 Tax=Caenorhabditis japonica TaxID=281687 RepID=A0A8R1I3Q3_CAEJA
MCIGFIKVAKSREEKYKLIILNNRDEDLDRPTAPMHWHDGVLSGVDEQDVARGTWLGMKREGKIGMLLSITQLAHTKSKIAPSRGGIVNSYLNADRSEDVLCSLKENATNFNGFQFVGIERNPETDLFEVKTLTNLLVDEIEVEKRNDACHVYSNSPPHIPFKKTEYGKQIFEDSLKCSDDLNVEQIFEKLLEIGTDRTSCFPDEQIKLQTGLPDNFYQPLASIYVRYPDEKRYGTRSHTLIAIDNNGKVTILERRMIAAKEVEKSEWIDEKFEFFLDN